jgi:hypothetical protein
MAVRIEKTGDGGCLGPRTSGTLCGMPKKESLESSPSADMQELREEMASLREIVRVLIDVAEGIREELQWVTRNGLPAGESSPYVPVVRRMAKDPTAPDWNQRLVLDRGNPAKEGAADTDQEMDQPNTVFELGDTVEFVWEGDWIVAEIVSVNVADGTAEVMLIDTQEGIIVSLDELEKIDMTERAEDEPIATPTPPRGNAPEQRQGSLF